MSEADSRSRQDPRTQEEPCATLGCMHVGRVARPLSFPTRARFCFDFHSCSTSAVLCMGACAHKSCICAWRHGLHSVHEHASSIIHARHDKCTALSLCTGMRARPPRSLVHVGKSGPSHCISDLHCTMLAAPIHTNKQKLAGNACSSVTSHAHTRTHTHTRARDVSHKQVTLVCLCV